MYVTEVHINNVRSIDSLDWQCDQQNHAGWHVFIGDNGSGKSSVL
jgi:predicted ATP-dependent endonuclease of OLD family